MMALVAAGLTEMKFFPAAVAGGIDYLRALASPLADAVFCTPGGISAETAADWLALSNVASVGGTWVAPRDLLAAGNFATIIARAKACQCLSG